MAERSFLILHGLAYDGDPGHWHARLAASLRDRDEAVAYPSLPDPESPSLERWLRIAGDELAGTADEVIVICHSLSVLLWLHLAPELERPVDRLLLVAARGPGGAGGGPGVPDRSTRYGRAAIQLALDAPLGSRHARPLQPSGDPGVGGRRRLRCGRDPRRGAHEPRRRPRLLALMRALV